jgi:arginyl-tRNA synthetase
MEIVLKEKIKEAVNILYKSEVPDDLIQIQETRKDFKGDFTLVVFPLLRFSKNTPEKTGETIGNYLIDKFHEVSDFNVIKGFLNLSVTDGWWTEYLRRLSAEKSHLENSQV